MVALIVPIGALALSSLAGAPAPWAGIPVVGGKNQSATHWDMVKDLRNGGRIELDGEVVQENGEWTF